MSMRLRFETSSRVVVGCILVPMALLLSCDDDDSNNNNYGTGGGAGTAGGNGEVGGKSSGGTGATGTGMNSLAGSSALGGNSNGAVGGGSGNGGTSANSGSTVAGAGTDSHGTAGTAGAAGSAATSFTSLYDNVIAARCLPCHSSGAGVSVGMLEMSTKALAFANLVGTNASGVPAMGTSPGAAQTTCASLTNLVRVHPGNATTSLLWQKVNSKLAGTNPPCGNPMPPGTGAALTQTQVNEIAAWINRGAPND